MESQTHSCNEHQKSSPWKRKYSRVFNDSWYECPQCNSPYYGTCVNSRYCGNCGYDYSFYRPCHSNGQLDLDYMTVYVYGCQRCHSQQDLNDYLLCKSCYCQLDQQEREDYKSRMKPSWTRIQETRTRQRFEREMAERERQERDFTPYSGNYWTGDGRMVYQEEGTRSNTMYCDKYCGYCGRCAASSYW